MDHFRNTNAEELAGREYNPERDAAVSLVNYIKAWGQGRNQLLTQADIALLLGTTAEQMSRAVNHGTLTIPTLRRWVNAWNERREPADWLVVVLDGTKIEVERRRDREVRDLYPRVS